ncbi:MAG: hypothetical protein KDE51_15575, partial [Anaerolineales bacterium]|nr:hypothetical protein [Anaerolineales bacterium]
MINTKKLSLVVIALTIILLAAGVAGAIPRWAVQEPVVDTSAAVSSRINYQGRLAAPNGAALNGTYAMRFIVYDADVGGSSLWDSGNLNIAVANGLFSVKLGVDQSEFNGQAMWLSIIVDGQTLSPRQEILPAPYALSLRPGADIVGDAINQSDAVLAGYAPATGTALYADANSGVGLYGESDGNYGVWGISDSSWGGYFTSREGHGIRVNTDGTDIYDYGAFITSAQGYGAYVQSESNQGVRAEAGNVSGINQPVGPVGLVGLGSNRGVFGSSGNGSGVYGSSDGNYGIWGQSET